VSRMFHWMMLAVMSLKPAPVSIWQVKSKLKGHQKRITGLAFSNALNVLVSSGADAQVLIPPSLFMTFHP
jgi:WD40 repeat protein